MSTTETATTSNANGDRIDENTRAVIEEICTSLQNYYTTHLPQAYPVTHLHDEEKSYEDDPKDPHQLLEYSIKICKILQGYSIADYTELSSLFKDKLAEIQLPTILPAYVSVRYNKNIPHLVIVAERVSIKGQPYPTLVVNQFTDAVSDIIIKSPYQGKANIYMNGLYLYSRFSCNPTPDGYEYKPVDEKENEVFKYPNMVSIQYISTIGLSPSYFRVEFMVDNNYSENFTIELTRYTFPAPLDKQVLDLDFKRSIFDERRAWTEKLHQDLEREESKPQ